MSFLSAAAIRTAVCVIALSGGGLWALRAMDAKADPPAADENAPCAEGRALFAAKLAYLEARISPEPSQADAWRSFANAMRDAGGEFDRACAGESPRPPSLDAGERLQRMEKHAAAMQAMFGAMAKAYVAIAPNLTTAQRDILSRNMPPFAGPLFPPLGGPGAPHPPGELAFNCGPGFHGWARPWGPPPF